MYGRCVAVIIVECNLDELFIKSLGFSRRSIKHESGKGEVLRRVRNNPVAIGMIDEDPYSSQPRDMERYEEKEVRGSVKLLGNRNNPKMHLIQVSPILEKWLYERARINRMPMDDYDLPRDPMKLHSYSGKQIEKDHNLHRFLRDFIEGDREAQYVKQWIEEALE